MSTLSFDIELKEQPVELVNPDGTKKEYILKEMDGRGRDKYMNQLQSNMVMKDGKPQGLKDYEGMHSSLLVRTLFDKESGKAASKEFIQGLPARVTAALFGASQTLNALSDSPETEEAVKND
jgi:hypothetical protein